MTASPALAPSASGGLPGDGKAEREHYKLQLYVAGTTSRSTQAVKNIRLLCERLLAGHYELEVIDIYLHPETAAQAQIIAAPTLIKLSPEPRRRAIGDLSDEVRVLAALNLVPDRLYGT